jgi:hypothetical protein
LQAQAARGDFSIFFFSICQDSEAVEMEEPQLGGAWVSESPHGGKLLADSVGLVMWIRRSQDLKAYLLQNNPNEQSNILLSVTITWQHI